MDRIKIILAIVLILSKEFLIEGGDRHLFRKNRSQSLPPTKFKGLADLALKGLDRIAQGQRRP